MRQPDTLVQIGILGDRDTMQLVLHNHLNGQLNRFERKNETSLRNGEKVCVSLKHGRGRGQRTRERSSKRQFLMENCHARRPNWEGKKSKY
jgi:hypothetical protein